MDDAMLMKKNTGDHVILHGKIEAMSFIQLRRFMRLF